MALPENLPIRRFPYSRRLRRVWRVVRIRTVSSARHPTAAPGFAFPDLCIAVDTTSNKSRGAPVIPGVRRIPEGVPCASPECGPPAESWRAGGDDDRRSTFHHAAQRVPHTELGL